MENNERLVVSTPLDAFSRLFRRDIMLRLGLTSTKTSFSSANRKVTRMKRKSKIDPPNLAGFTYISRALNWSHWAQQHYLQCCSLHRCQRGWWRRLNRLRQRRRRAAGLMGPPHGGRGGHGLAALAAEIVNQRPRHFAPSGCLRLSFGLQGYAEY